MHLTTITCLQGLWDNPQLLVLLKKMIFYPLPSSCKFCKDRVLEGEVGMAWRLHTTGQRMTAKPP